MKSRLQQWALLSPSNPSLHKLLTATLTYVHTSSDMTSEDNWQNARRAQAGKGKEEELVKKKLQIPYTKLLKFFKNYFMTV